MDTAELFMDGNEQAVRLPEGYAFNGSEVAIRRVGSAVVLLPKNHSWDDFWAILDAFSDDFMADREQPPFPDE